MATTAARCSSIVVTPDGGAALTAVFPISCSVIRDDELVEKQYSDSRQKSYYAGAEVKGITLTVCDLEFWEGLFKGKRVTTAIVKLESTLDTDGTAHTVGDVVTATLTTGIVTEAVSMESSTDGAPVEYAITIMLCRDTDGTEGTFVIS